MVEDRITDGRRIAQLLASEVHGREDGALDQVAVTDADPDVDPSTDGTLAYRLTVPEDAGETGAGARPTEPFGAVYVHPDRVRVELGTGLEAAAEVAEAADLRVRPRAVEPPRVLLFVESGAEVKRAVDAIDAAAGAD